MYHCGLKQNLLSVSKLVRSGWQVSFMEEVKMISPHGEEVKVHLSGGLYIINISTGAGSDVIGTSNYTKVEILHQRGCHMGPHGGCGRCMEQKGQRNGHKKARPEHLVPKKFNQSVHISFTPQLQIVGDIFAQKRGANERSKSFLT